MGPNGFDTPMNLAHNPYIAGAGLPPPILAGRDALRNTVRIAIARLRVGRSAKSVLMVGLRGVGKTVLLQQMRLDAEGEGVYTLQLTSHETLSLPVVLAIQLREFLRCVSCISAPTAIEQGVCHQTAYSASTLKGALTSIQVDSSSEAEGEPPSNGGQLEDLSTTLERAGLAAKSKGTALVIFIDDAHNLEKSQLGTLISALQRCSLSRLPVMLVGAGLAPLRELAGDAKAYAERLFYFPGIELLSGKDAAQAITQPAGNEGITFETAAVDLIVEKTRGHPYIIQEWCKQAWVVACDDTITVTGLQNVLRSTLASLDEGFFRICFDLLNAREKQYLQAMADICPEKNRTGKISDRMGNNRVKAVASVRRSLIAKGLIWGPSYGDTVFAIPFFDGFIKRSMGTQQEV
jgi:hypothetical protein